MTNPRYDTERLDLGNQIKRQDDNRKRTKQLHQQCFASGFRDFRGNAMVHAQNDGPLDFLKEGRAHPIKSSSLFSSHHSDLNLREIYTMFFTDDLLTSKKGS